MQFPLVLIATVQVGGYISVWKVIPLLVVLLGWGRVLTWIDKDTEAAHLPREMVNIGMLGALILAFLLMIVLPLPYAATLPIFLFFFIGSVVGYFLIRKAKVGVEDLKKDLQNWRAGRKKGEKVVAPPGAVGFVSKNASILPAPDSESPDRPAYDAAQQMLADGLLKNAERIEVTPSDAGAQVRFLVDGVAYTAANIERALAAEGVTYLKRIAGLDINEKRKPQSATTKVVVNGKKHELDITTQGSAAGEFVKVQVDPKKRHSLRLEELGLSPEQLQSVQSMISDSKGVVLICSPKSQGLTSMLYAVLRGHDAFVQHLQTVERSPDQDVEGITQNKLPANASPADERKQVEWVTSQEPDVLMVSQVEDPGSAKALIDFVRSSESGKRVYVGIRAGSTFDAMALWRKMVGDDKLALDNLRMVISGRIMRRLCAACKEGYTPDPDTLRKLNMNPASNTTLYQERKNPIRTEKGEIVPCTFCKELRFNGRFGVFEVLVVDDDIRQAALAGGSANLLKAAFRKQRGKLLQEMALAAVERGDTSVKEMVRVLKGETAPASTTPAAAPAAAGAARAPTGAPRAASAPTRATGTPRATGAPRTGGSKPPPA